MIRDIGSLFHDWGYLQGAYRHASFSLSSPLVHLTQAASGLSWHGHGACGAVCDSSIFHRLLSFLSFLRRALSRAVIYRLSLGPFDIQEYIIIPFILYTDSRQFPPPT